MEKNSSTCIICGKPYDPGRYPRRKTCGPACADVNRKASKNKSRDSRVAARLDATAVSCPICGETFRPRNTTQKACSKLTCRRAYRAQVMREAQSKRAAGLRTVYRKTCACGKEFETAIHNQQSCSKACAIVARRKSQRVYEAQRPPRVRTAKPKSTQPEPRRLEPTRKADTLTLMPKLKAKPPKPKFERTCKHCGETFLTTDSRRVVCEDYACRIKHANADKQSAGYVKCLRSNDFYRGGQYYARHLVNADIRRGLARKTDFAWDAG